MTDPDPNLRRRLMRESDMHGRISLAYADIDGLILGWNKSKEYEQINNLWHIRDVVDEAIGDIQRLKRRSQTTHQVHINGTLWPVEETFLRPDDIRRMADVKKDSIVFTIADDVLKIMPQQGIMINTWDARFCTFDPALTEVAA